MTIFRRSPAGTRSNSRSTAPVAALLACPLAALALLLQPLEARAQERPALRARGLELLKEGDRQADEGKPNDAVMSYKAAFEQLLPGMRGIPFLREVGSDVTEREKLGEYLIQDLEKEMTPEEFLTSERIYQDLGLIPRDMDLKAFMVRLLSEEVAAFYDPRTGKMHMIKEPDPDPDAPKPGLLEKLFGRPSGFDKDQNKTVIAHELTHALADQHYDLHALQQLCKGDDDRAVALSSLVEGEATLAMMGAQMADWDGTQSASIPSATLARTFNMLGPMMALGGGKTMREAPPILAEGLTFPYLRGAVFVAHLTNKGGWAAVDEAYRNPPLSTEQILHPEKYRDRPDPPQAIDIGQPPLPEGWREIGRNVVGEMQLEILLRKHGPRKASEGWDGDLVAVHEGPEGRRGLVWMLTWDAPEDPAEFAAAFLKSQTARLGPEATDPKIIPESLRRPVGDAVFALETVGLDTIVVEGFPPEATEAIIDHLKANAVKTEKVFTPPAPAGSKPDDH